MARIENDRDGISPNPAPMYDTYNESDDADDDIYEPANEDEESDEASDEDGNGEDEDEDEFMDAAEAPLDVIELMIGDPQAEESEETETTNDGEQQPQANRRGVTTATITLPAGLRDLIDRHAIIRQLLQTHQIRGLDLEINDDDEMEYSFRRRRRRKTPVDPDRFPKVPSDAGRALMYSGVFGNKESHVDIRRKRRRTINERLLWRRLGADARSSSRRYNRFISQDMVPTTDNPDRIIHYDSRAYSGQFSDDGNFFFSCTQDFKVRMYDTSNPYDWKYYKTVDYPYGQWTITDATLSPDNKFLAYSSIRRTVCLAPTDPTDHSDHTVLDFINYAPGAGDGDPRFMGRSHGFGIWSLRFSGDGREIVAGTSDSAVLVYDLETRKTILKLTKHTDDVNAVCFGDKSSPHILYSGSDDQTLRVWDRRSMADRREAGIFVGHTEGLTYVDSKGDGRYVLSNGKDQMMKLWDLRKMVSPAAFEGMDLSDYTSNFDYRFNLYDEDEYTPNPNDCSVVTFRGHRVLKTLIRCHFSPPTSSNSRYVYTGSEDGKIWIYNMDGTVKAKIDVETATKNTRTRNSEAMGYDYDITVGGSRQWKTCVRDASWSPTSPVIAATSWNGWGMSTGTVSMHSWNDNAEDDEGDPPLGAGYNHRLDRRDEFNEHLLAKERAKGSRGLRSRAVRPQRRGQSRQDDDDDEDNDGW